MQFYVCCISVYRYKGTVVSNTTLWMVAWTHMLDVRHRQVHHKCSMTNIKQRGLSAAL